MGLRAWMTTMTHSGLVASRDVLVPPPSRRHLLILKGLK